MSRLQVGGLALIINGKFEENIGSVVELVELCMKKSPFDGVVREFWKVKHGKPAKGMNSLGKITFGNFTHNIPKNLMPLGDKQTQNEFKKELEHV